MTILELFKEESMDDDAHEYAKKAHEGVLRKGGGPYVAHPERVADKISKYKPNSKNIESLKAAAYLHDTLEDDERTTEDILKNKFGELITSLVKELTSDKEEQKKQGKTTYLSKKVVGLSNYALTLKLCDRLDNIEDLNQANPSFRKKYKKETEEIIKYLEEHRDLSPTQKNIIKDIKETLSKIILDKQQ